MPLSPRPTRRCLDGQLRLCYKKCFAPYTRFKPVCEGAYSAVAQWQSIRLLTEGL